MGRRSWAGTLAIVSMCLIGAAAGQAVNPVSAAASGGATFVSMTNSARSDHGVSSVSSASDLTTVAQNWADKMAASGTLSHNPQLTSQVGHWNKLGENVGYGPDMASIQDAFMHSAGHRANILDPDFSQLGVGVTVKNGVVWVAEVFRQPDGTQPAATHHVVKKHHKQAPAKPKARTWPAKQHPAKTSTPTHPTAPKAVIEVDRTSSVTQPSSSPTANPLQVAHIADVPATTPTVPPAKPLVTAAPTSAAPPLTLANDIQAAGPVARPAAVLAPAVAPAKPAGPSLPSLPLAAGIGLIALIGLGVSLRVR